MAREAPCCPMERYKKVEKIGEHEKAYVRATMFKKPALPDFDVGYDIV